MQLTMPDQTVVHLPNAAGNRPAADVMNGATIRHAAIRRINVMFLIDEELCIGCGQCVSACPAGAIMLRDSKAVIDQSACRQCGICADQCPEHAISESIPTYATQAEQRKPLPQQQSGVLSQVLDIAGRLLVEGLRHMGTGGGRGRGGKGGHFGRGGGFRGSR